MARPRKDAPLDEFTATEMAVAGALPVRNFLLLVERGLVPVPKRFVAGKGGMRAWDSAALEQIAIVGALNNAGLGLIPAARLVSIIIGELLAVYREVLSGFRPFYRNKEFRARYPNFPWYPSKEYPEGAKDSFWQHHYLRMLTDVCPPRRAQHRDVFLEIVDQQYVLHRAQNSPLQKHPPGLPAEPLCRITNWGRGEDVSIRAVWDEVGGALGEPGPDANWAELCAEIKEAVDNAASLLTINLSRAIRDGFDNVHEHRAGGVSDGK